MTTTKHNGLSDRIHNAITAAGFVGLAHLLTTVNTYADADEATTTVCDAGSLEWWDADALFNTLCEIRGIDPCDPTTYDIDPN